MKHLLIKKYGAVRYRLVIFTIIACAMAAASWSSNAHPSAVSSITVTNNSSREIRYLYLSPVDQDNWGADQLNGASLNNGQSVTLSDVSCSGSEIKVIGEDRDGCFLYSVVSCTGNAQWTVTNSTPADCGGQ